MQRFLAGELTAEEAIVRIRRHPGVIDEDTFSEDPLEPLDERLSLVGSDNR